MLRGETGLHRFLDSARARLEWPALGALLLLTLAQPTTTRLDLPTWALVLVLAVYKLLVELLRSCVAWLQPFGRKYVAELPVNALVYFLAVEPGGLLFVLFFLSVVCAAASLPLGHSVALYGSGRSAGRGHRRHVAAVVARRRGSPRARRPADPAGAFAAGVTVLTRPLELEQAAARAVRDEAARLSDLDRLRTDFVSVVSHDLRTPLTRVPLPTG